MSLVFSNPGNVTTFTQQLAYINSLTDFGSGGILGIGFIVLIGGLLFLMLKSYSFERAFSVSGIVVGLCAIFLRILNLINDTVVTICVILSVLGIILLIKEASQYEN